MRRYTRGEISWRVLPLARPALDRVRNEYPSEDAYRRDRASLQDFLCEYFSDIGCVKKLGKSIAPLGGASNGGKILKVRWNRPGQGKSGGLRLIAVVYCDALKVTIAHAFVRVDDLTDEEIAVATKDC